MASYRLPFENYNGRIWIKPDPALNLPKTIVKGKDDIKVTEAMLGDDTIYTVSYSPYIAPKLSLVANPSILEVGQQEEVIFTLNITLGSEIIKSTVVNPSRVITNNIFSAVCGDNQPGLRDVHTVTLTDNRDTVVVASAGVYVQSRYHVGTVARGTTTFVGNSSKLASSIREAFGSLTDYSIPEGQQHVAWLVPVGETLPKVVDANGFEWETTGLGQHIIADNGYGLSVTYNLMVTKNFYVGPDNVSIKLKFS